MTDEAKPVTDHWIEQRDAEFAYGFDKKNDLARWFGVRGIPHAVLVDPSGTILWRGQPQNLKSSTIDEALKGALETPISDWPKSASKVAKYVRKADFAKAVQEAEKLGAEGGSVLAAVRQLADGKRDSIERWIDQGDYLNATERGKGYLKELKGLPQGEAIERMLTEVEEDDDAQDVLDAQERVAKLMGRKIKKGSIPKLTRELKQIAAKYAGTGAGRDAKAALQRLR